MVGTCRVKQRHGKAVSGDSVFPNKIAKSIMTDYGKLYDEFLYDCHVANQRLTEEDWIYYGSEAHHIEIPDREGGSLTPLNSQRLTLYQHWVAGVLQSEVLGKCCFAFVPKNSLPFWLEELRIKWTRYNGIINTTKVHQSRTQEERRERAILANSALSGIERSELLLQVWSNRTEEEKFSIISKGWETRKKNGNASQAGKKTASQVWESTVDGFRSSAGNVARHNKSKGWDPDARTRIV